jgi:hypothetical protein
MCSQNKEGMLLAFLLIEGTSFAQITKGEQLQFISRSFEFCLLRVGSCGAFIFVACQIAERKLYMTSESLLFLAVMSQS